MLSPVVGRQPRRRKRSLRAFASAAVPCAMTGLLVLLAALPRPAAAQVTLQPPPRIAGMAKGVSDVLDATYMGVGIEPSNLPSFSSPDGHNPLTYQLLSNFAKWMGAPPHVRIGGNSGDNMLYDPSNTSLVIERNPNPKGQGKEGSETDAWVYGDAYYKAMDNFPEATPITFGFNLAYNASDSTSRVVQQAASILDALQRVTVNTLEIGNEPDLFIDNEYRPESWTAQDWGQEWIVKAEAVYDQVLKPRHLRQDLFEAACTATTATKNGQPYRISNLMSTPVAKHNGKFLRGWNQHDYLHYVGVSQVPINIDRLLNLPITMGQFDEWASQAQQASQTGKPYYIREMGSIGPTGIKGISDTFANTLWTFNFFLYASTRGVSSVQMHMTDNSYSAPWQPNVQYGVGAHVRSSYYGYAAMAQIIGTGCNTNIAWLDIDGIPDPYDGRLAAYGVYRMNVLQSIVLINTKPYGPNTQDFPPPPKRQHAHLMWRHRRQDVKSDRPSLTFSISLPNLQGKPFVLSHLMAATSDTVTNTTWNGLEFESSGSGAPNHVNETDSRTRQKQATVGQDGKLKITVQDSSAVVANLNVVLGADDGHPARCAANGSAPTNTPEGEGNNSGFIAQPPNQDGLNLSKTAIIIVICVGVGAALLASLLTAALVRYCMKKKQKQRPKGVTIAQAMAGGAPVAGGSGYAYGAPFSPSGTDSRDTMSHSREHMTPGPGYGMAEAQSVRPGSTGPQRSASSPRATPASVGYNFNYDHSHTRSESGLTLSSAGGERITASDAAVDLYEDYKMELSGTKHAVSASMPGSDASYAFSYAPHSDMEHGDSYTVRSPSSRHVAPSSTGTSLAAKNHGLLAPVRSPAGHRPSLSESQLASSSGFAPRMTAPHQRSGSQKLQIPKVPQLAMQSPGLRPASPAQPNSGVEPLALTTSMSPGVQSPVPQWPMQPYGQGVPWAPLASVPAPYGHAPPARTVESGPTGGFSEGLAERQAYEAWHTRFYGPVPPASSTTHLPPSGQPQPGPPYTQPF